MQVFTHSLSLRPEEKCFNEENVSNLILRGNNIIGIIKVNRERENV